MELRFYEDPDTGQPHIYKHGVTEQELKKSYADMAKTCARPETRAGRSAKLWLAATCKSSTCLMRILTAYSWLLRMNHRARPRKPSVGDNGGNRNEKAEISPWLG
jgi:hypothetical protein